jgi:hypothetical protein
MALVAGFIGVVSFLVLAGTVGDDKAKMGRVFLAELLALGLLIVATGAHRVGQSDASVKDDVAIERMSRGEYWNPLVAELTVKDLQTSFASYRAAGFTVRFQRADPPFAYLDGVKPSLCLSCSTSVAGTWLRWIRRWGEHQFPD